MAVISASVDVTKIDKSRFFIGKPDENGHSSKYLDITLIPTPNSKYDDDYMVVQSVSKEEREGGMQGAILGNAKIFGERPQEEHQPPTPAESQFAPEPQAQPKPTPAIVEDDVPF